jgi:hypothetical protein
MNHAFGSLIVLQFLLIGAHDIVDVPGWTHGRQVQAVIGKRKVWLVTLINSIFPGLAAGTAIAYWTRTAPPFVSGYWVLYCAATVASAVTMWYIPYLAGASEKQRVEYERMYAGTHQVLPARGDNPRPNLLHVCFHVLFVVNLVLSAVLWVRSR